LKHAGTREIGGQIYGEQLAPSDFRAMHLTVQRVPGSFAAFVVDVVQAARDAARFFHVTKHDYKRFNYLGEWHSHPSFAVTPSSHDVSSMQQLVESPDFRGLFAVLMIVRLDGNDLRHGAWFLDPLGARGDVTLEFE
jgi:hypothetical protein